MTMYNPGDIVLVNFPFADLVSSKVRPALVITTKGEDIIVVGIFSKVPEVLRDSWVVIEETLPYFNRSGLRKGSVIKAEKIAVIHQSVVRRKLGTLPSEAMRSVKEALKRTLGIE